MNATTLTTSQLESHQFDVILANPPHSIKQWDRAVFTQDKWGRHFLWISPQGRADNAFFQPILASLSPQGRYAILWPHGILFWNEEQTMRATMVEQDGMEAVNGLGPDLFYHSPMASCVVVCHRRKLAARRGQVLFIDAVNEVTREWAQRFLKAEHQQRILEAYHAFADVPEFAKVATLQETAANGANLSIPLYVKRNHQLNNGGEEAQRLHAAWETWQADSRVFWQQMEALVETLDGLSESERPS